MISDIDRLLRAAARVRAGEGLTAELLAEEGVPVPLRLLVAATGLAAADQPVNKLAMTTSAPAARSAAYRDHADLMERLIQFVPALVHAQLQATRREVSVADLTARLHQAHRTIAQERARREAAEAELADVVSYARELHWQLKPEHEAAMREREEKVRVLRVAPTPEHQD